MHTLSVNPVNLILALSEALELINMGLSDHHYRTAIISFKLARHLGLLDEEIQTVTYSVLLHDIGASSRWEENSRLVHFEEGDYVYEHAEAGYSLLAKSLPLQKLALPIRYHHDRFDGRNPSGLSGESIPLASRIIHLADRIEVLVRNEGTILLQRKEIENKIKCFAGSYFDPYLVEKINCLASKDFFWLDLFNNSYRSRFFRNLGFFGHLYLRTSEIIGIAEVFASIIDQTSRFTANHSRNVASVAAYLGELRGFCQEETESLQVAGLLHDLGKLSISNKILEKPGSLSVDELSLIRQHPYYSMRILEQVEGFTTIAAWAGAHHEAIDGSGYPFGLDNRDLRVGARIISVADIFCALQEDRPYRARMSTDETKGIMSMMGNKDKLDRKLVKELLDNFDAAKNKVLGNEIIGILY